MSDEKTWDEEKTRIQRGEIKVELDGEEYWLKPTLEAFTNISRQFGGFGPARAALVSESVEAAIYVLRQGLSWPDKKTKMLPEIVFKMGLNTDLLTQLILFVANLNNGGKPVMEPRGDDDGRVADAGN